MIHAELMIEFTLKQFNYNVGLTGNGSLSFRVKLVCKKLKRQWLVITAYPI